MMKVRFYFDYSDYRSYLMMHSLGAIDGVPVQVQWVAVDAYSLRALSGSTARGQTPLEREFLRKEALRFCEREGIEFVWQPDWIQCGTALQGGVWMMLYEAGNFEAYSRRVLESVWGRGKMIDASRLRAIVEEIGGDPERVFRDLDERACFQYQDACLQEALSDGVFDVPALVVGDAVIGSFESGDEILRVVLTEYLRTLPSSLVLSSLARHLMSEPREAFANQMGEFARRSGIRQSVAVSGAMNMGRIQHTLVSPKVPWALPKTAVGMGVPCAVSAAKGDAVSMFSASREGAITVCVTPGVAVCEASAFEALPLASMGTRVWVSPVMYRDVLSLWCLYLEKGTLHSVVLGMDGHDLVLTGMCGQVKWMAVAGEASRDLNLARLAAHLGVHVLIRLDMGEGMSEAAGVLASAWVVEIHRAGGALCDMHGHRCPLSPGEVWTLEDSRTLSAPSTELWTPSAPRTLLLVEKSVSFGELVAGADVELACRGADLTVTTASQSSSISATRDFASLRIDDVILAIVPLSGDQLFVSELATYRLLSVFNRMPRKATPIFVNYWADLEFEMLEIMRPVFSAYAAMFLIPVVLVVGSQIVEIWLVNAQGVPYRIEKDDDCFTIDAQELLNVDRGYEKILGQLGTDSETFIARLERIEKVGKSGKEERG